MIGAQAPGTRTAGGAGRFAHVPSLGRLVGGLSCAAGMLAVSAAFALPSASASPTAIATTTTSLSPASVQGREWWIERLNLHKAWRITRGAGTTVAVLDTGVDAHFGDLRGALVPGFATTGGSSKDTDPALHGTRIADDIGGRGTGFGLLGVAPDAKILPVRQQDTVGTDGTVVGLDRLAAMVDPPQVANLSYGTPGACPRDVETSVARAIHAGIVVVAAAGNTGSTSNEPLFPADCRGVVAVGAVNRNARSWSGSQRHRYVALAGPGVHLIGYDAQAASGFGFSTGTSDSAAMVSGILALVRAHFPSESPRQAVARVLATTHQFDGAQGSRNDRTGYGIALPFNALTRHVPAGAPNPIYDELAGSGGTPPSASPGSSNTPPAPAGAPASTSASGEQAAAPAAFQGGGSTSGSGSTGTIVVVVVGVFVVALIAVIVFVRSRRRVAGSAGPPWHDGQDGQDGMPR